MDINYTLWPFGMCCITCIHKTSYIKAGPTHPHPTLHTLLLWHWQIIKYRECCWYKDSYHTLKFECLVSWQGREQRMNVYPVIKKTWHWLTRNLGCWHKLWVDIGALHADNMVTLSACWYRTSRCTCCKQLPGSLHNSMTGYHRLLQQICHYDLQ